MTGKRLQYVTCVVYPLGNSEILQNRYPTFILHRIPRKMFRGNSIEFVGKSSKKPHGQNMKTPQRPVACLMVIPRSIPHKIPRSLHGVFIHMFAQVEFSGKSFTEFYRIFMKDFPWKVLHIIPWSINLGPLFCRIAENSP